MVSMRGLAALALVTFVAACSSDTQNEQINADTTALAPADAGVPSAPVTANLQSVGNSGVSGEATASHTSDSVTVQVSLSGLTATEPYPAHIHRGTCASGGPVAVPLTSVTAAGGSGNSTTTVAVVDLGSTSDPLFVQAHDPTGTPVACGDLPGHGAPAGTTTGM